MSEPDILVKRCGIFCLFFGLLTSGGYCSITEKSIKIPNNRRFPRHCPLKKGTITVAAVKRTIK